MTTKHIKDVLSSILEKYKDRVIFAYLFGSVAQNNMQPLSDIDIAIFLSDTTKESYFNIKLSLYEVDPKVKTIMHQV